jgi:hypothetical protein
MKFRKVDSPAEVFGILLFAIAALAGYNYFYSANSFRTHFSFMRSLVFVSDLPDTPNWQDETGKYIDLGYQFDSISGGEWVAVVGAPKPSEWGRVRSYIPLDDNALKTLLAGSGVTALPAVPTRTFPILTADAICSFLVFGLIAAVFKTVFMGLTGGDRSSAIKAATALNAGQARSADRPANQFGNSRRSPTDFGKR